MKTLLLLALCLGLFEGVDERERAVARPILTQALEQLEGRFQVLGFVPTLEDSWPGVLDRLREGRTETWDTWKLDLERHPQELAGLPGFATRLASGSRRDDGYYVLTVGDLRNVGRKAPLTWTDEDRRVLLGVGLERPTELAYGWDATALNWFFCMRVDLELAGARTVADRLAKLQPVKEHWFERQLEVFQALRGAVR